MQSPKHATTHEQAICGLHVHPKTCGVHGLGEERSHSINTFLVGVYGPHFHSTLTLPSLRWVLGCWTTISTWKPRWVGGPTLWVYVRAYSSTLTYICHMCIHFPFHSWHHHPLWSFSFIKKYRKWIETILELVKCKHLFESFLHNKILFEWHKHRLYFEQTHSILAFILKVLL